MLKNNIDIKIFFAFYELLYIPVVFGLPILSIIVLFKCLKLKIKSFRVYLCLSLAISTIILFGIKIFFLVSKNILIF